MILDTFAGAGGWDEGARSVGIADVIGLEWERNACRTRSAAGHRTVRTDVAVYPTEPFAGKVRGLIASPPCQAFSTAGKRLGMMDLPRIHRAVEGARGGWRDDLRDGPWEDPRSVLILEPLRWAWALRPEWIACEQVPPAMPVWEHMASVLRSWGWDALAVRLLAADYGVPQTRLRALLLAHRNGVRVPAPTHAKHPVAGLFGPALKPWVSMAETLGWSLSHGREVFVRCEGRRQDVPEFSATAKPARCIRSNTRDWRLRVGNQEHSAEAPAEAPAPTLLFGHRMNDVRWVEERPATTICNDIVSGPGHRDMGPEGPHRQDAEGSVRIELHEAAILQGFPADYPFQGSRTACFRQVGDAFCPPLAAAIIEALNR